MAANFFGNRRSIGIPFKVKASSQYSEWTDNGPLSSATCSAMILQFTGCHQPVLRFYWPENAIDWLREC